MTSGSANAVTRKVRERLVAGDMGMLKEKCPTITKYGQKWLDSPLRGQAESTLVKYQEAFDLHIKSYFGNKRIDEIKKRHVKDFISQLRSKKLSTSRSQVILSVLSGIFDNAVEDELIKFNPCQKTRKYCEKTSGETLIP